MAVRKRNVFTLLGTSAALLTIGALTFFFGKDIIAPAPQPTVIAGTNHFLGNPNSLVVVEEFVDYQCEACADYDEINKEIVARYGDKIVFFVRHFPIADHQYAMLAAQTAEAAGAQNKFWEMHEMLLQQQSEWVDADSPQSLFDQYGQTLGLDTKQIQSNLNTTTYTEAIEQDHAYGESINLDAIPSILINGKNEGYIEDVEVLADKIDQALQQEAARVPAQSPPVTQSQSSTTTTQKEGGLLSWKNTLRLIWIRLTSEDKKSSPVCVNVCKSGDCVCEIADIEITLHGEKPKQREEINDMLEQLRKLKYVPAKGGLSFVGRKLLDRAIDEIEKLAKQAEKIGRKLTGVDVYATIVAQPCTSVACATTTKWTWGDEQSQTVLILPPIDCQNKYVPGAWDEKCLQDKNNDFSGYISRQAKKACPNNCQ